MKISNWAVLFLALLPLTTLLSGCGGDSSDDEACSYRHGAQAGSLSLIAETEHFLLQLREIDRHTVATCEDEESLTLPTTDFAESWEELFGIDFQEADLAVDGQPAPLKFRLSRPVFDPALHTVSYVAVPDNGQRVLHAAAPGQFGQSSLTTYQGTRYRPGDAGYSSNVMLQVAGTTQNSVIVSYSLLPGMSPRALGAGIIAWMDTGAGPIGAELTINDAGPAGSIEMPALSPGTTDYVFSLVTGAGSQAVLAKYILPKASSYGTFEGQRISLAYVEATQVVVNYQLIPGSNPKSNGYGMRLWQGSSALPQITPLAAASFSSDADSGTLVIANVPIIRGTQYTAALSVSSRPGDIAATVTFSS